MPSLRRSRGTRQGSTGAAADPLHAIDEPGAHANDDLLSQVVMERMLAGVATRRYARVNEPVGDHLDAQLEARWPDAAAGLREGLEDRFTVRRLGVGGQLAASLSLRSPVTSKL